MEKIVCILMVSTCLLIGNNIHAQVIILNNFGVEEGSYYKAHRVSKSKLSGNDLNLEGLPKTINSIPASLLSYTIVTDKENRDALSGCERNLTGLWRQYQKSYREKETDINYQELYHLWQTKDKFCSDLLGKTSLKLHFNFIASAQSNYYLQKIIVETLAYPGSIGATREIGVSRDWMSGFQREEGFQQIVLAPSIKNENVKLDKPLIIEKQGTLRVNFSSMHYQYLTPGSLQQGNYIVQLKFVFLDNSMKEHVVNTPVFLVRI
jgi:hypothetical protein